MAKLVYYGAQKLKLKNWQRIVFAVGVLAIALGAGEILDRKVENRFSLLKGKTNLYKDDTLRIGIKQKQDNEMLNWIESMEIMNLDINFVSKSIRIINKLLII